MHYSSAALPGAQGAGDHGRALPGNGAPLGHHHCRGTHGTTAAEGTGTARRARRAVAAWPLCKRQMAIAWPVNNAAWPVNNHCVSKLPPASPRVAGWCLVPKVLAGSPPPSSCCRARSPPPALHLPAPSAGVAPGAPHCKHHGPTIEAPRAQHRPPPHTAARRAAAAPAGTCKCNGVGEFGHVVHGATPPRRARPGFLEHPGIPRTLPEAEPRFQEGAVGVATLSAKYAVPHVRPTPCKLLNSCCNPPVNVQRVKPSQNPRVSSTGPAPSDLQVPAATLPALVHFGCRCRMLSSPCWL